VLDVATGGGRHARWFAARGHPVDAVDRDAAALAEFAGVPGITATCADLESGPCLMPVRPSPASWLPITCTARCFRICWRRSPRGRPDLRDLRRGQREIWPPCQPEFLLQPGELLEVVRGRLRVVAYEDVFVTEPRPAMVQRLCASMRRPDPPCRKILQRDSTFFMVSRYA